jgi:glycosyltransferase involved in cell wall biosynthesis
VRLSILMISPQFRPLVGGYERSAERLSGALARRGMRVEVITERREPSWPKRERRGGYEIRRLPCLYRRHLHGATSSLSLAVFLMRHGANFDVWHVHQYGAMAGVAIAMGRAVGRPVVVKLTSSREMGIESALGRGWRGGLLRNLHRQASAYIATSAEVRAEAESFGIASDRIRVIPNGVDASNFSPASSEQRLAARRALGLKCERLVLYVGRLSPEKNVLGLVDAWAAMGVDGCGGAMLVLVGDGPEADAIRAKIAMLRLQGSVVLAGYQEHVACWYQAADICVVPSRREGLSNAMVEAMASGVPVVSSAVSGSSVLLTDPASGVVVPVGDVQQLGAAISTLLREAGMRLRLGENARARFLAAFSLAGVATQMTALYEQLSNLDVMGRKGGAAADSNREASAAGV